MRIFIFYYFLVISASALAHEGLENPGNYNQKFFTLLSKSGLKMQKPFGRAEIYEAYDVFCLMTPQEDGTLPVSCELYDRPKALDAAKLTRISGDLAVELLELMRLLPVNQGTSGAESEIIRCGRYDYGNNAIKIDCRLSVKLEEDRKTKLQ
ncbi:MAG: hypothetical protein AABY64_07730 [Bdellovibrionota bacterium]